MNFSIGATPEYAESTQLEEVSQGLAGRYRESLRVVLFQSELGEIISRDRTNDLQTFRADFVHGVFSRVPVRKIEIDNVDRRNPDGVQRRVIIGDFPV